MVKSAPPFAFTWHHGGMNYLAHLYLAERTQTSLLGNLMGDFVRGRLRGDHPPAIELGIRLHRRVDSYTDRHPRVVASRRRLRPPFRRYAGILVDVFYDHFLARDWARLHDQPLEVFAARVYAALEANPELLGERLRRAAPYFRRHDLLVSYRELGGIEHALAGLSARLSRRNPLGAGLIELQRNYAGLENDFRAFLPELEVYARVQAERLRETPDPMASGITNH